MEERWSAVDRYITDLFGLSDEHLERGLEASAAGGLPAIQVSPPLGKLLHLLARSVGARQILEIGTLGGYSGTWLARDLPAGGRLTTLELDPHHAEVARRNFARAGVADAVEVRVGRAADSLARLASERRGPYDLIFIDADKAGYPDYLTWSLKLSHQGTLIVADNVVRRAAVGETPGDDANVTGIRRFNEMLAREPRVSATIVQTVGVKGYDGFAIALVTKDG